MLAYLDKYRVSYNQKTSRFKEFSQINERNIDKEGTYVIIDDMYSTGGSAGSVAILLKKLGAKRVEVWTTHPVTMPEHYEKANNRKNIDLVVSLNTVPQSPDLNVEYINDTAYLLAAELYKAHQKLVALR